VDWDNDERKDIVTGERNGKIRIYLNTGSDSDPTFSGYTYVQLGGDDFDVGTTSAPYILDWNNDGKKDILCGEDYGGIRLLINEGTDAQPVFNTVEVIMDGIVPLDVGSRAAPVAVDGTGDGRKDLLVGETSGHIFFFRNVGTDENPEFEGSLLLEAGGAVLDVESYSRLDVADWDGDGVNDILCGHRGYAGVTGGVHFFHALGALSVPENTLSRTQGGAIPFVLDAGKKNRGRVYFLLASAHGTSPGVTLPGGAVLPLVWDNVFTFVKNHHNWNVCANFRGRLNANGRAFAVLNTPGVPLPAGSILHFAFTTEYPYDFQSNPVAIEIIP
jgi:hypothetical protein